MFCLMEGRHVHPSTLYPGGVGTVPSVQLFTDYLVRLMRYIEFMKKCVPLHDDLFDFFYEALPGYEEVGRRRILLGCWGSYQDPDKCDYQYRHMTDWGRAMFVTPGVIVDGKLVTTDLVDINLQIRILLGSSYYDGWENCETFVSRDPLGNPVDKEHPWNQTTLPRPQKRNFDGNYSWVMSPRWLDKRTGDHLALDTGGGAIARLWSTALAGLVDIGYVKATGNSVKIYLPKTALKPEMELEWKIPKWSNTIERDRARTYFQAYCAAAAMHFVEKALAEVQAGRTRTWSEFKVPDEAIGCGFHEAVRGVLSHHLVIRNGKIANYHPYPPTPWNANPRDRFGTPGPYEDAVQGTPLFEENGPDNFKGIDIICQAPIAARHPHLIELSNRGVVCACPDCADTQTARRGSPCRLIPQNLLLLRDFAISDAQWAAFQIPIDLVFVFLDSAARRPVALYPGAAGAIQSALGLEAWSELAAGNPVLNELAPDVEALLVNRTKEVSRILPGADRPLLCAGRADPHPLARAVGRQCGLGQYRAIFRAAAERGRRCGQFGGCGRGGRRWLTSISPSTGSPSSLTPRSRPCASRCASATPPRRWRSRT